MSTLPVPPGAVDQLQLEVSPSIIDVSWQVPDDGGLQNVVFLDDWWICFGDVMLNIELVE